MIWLLLTLSSAWAQEASCANETASAAFQQGFKAQKERRSDDALSSYNACIAADPSCVPCLYEVGWTYWTRSQWDEVIGTWEKVLTIDPNHAAAKTWLPQAKDQKGGTSTPSATGLHIPMGVKSSPSDAAIELELVGRFQNYSAAGTTNGDHYDTDIYSPKSARFLGDGSKVYVNSLEGLKTVVYDPRTIEKFGVIEHDFKPSDSGLFQGQSSAFDYPFYRHGADGNDNVFAGKPVESALSHNDRWLWVPYYRRDFDVGARSPSAVAIIDTTTDKVVRVIPTGPIPKYVAISPDNRWAAITHWGDNTVAMVDISSGDPAQFAYRKERLVVEKILPQANLGGDRDSSCGFCLRGTTFTPDGSTLLVSRMGDGGIAGFDVASGKYLGTVLGMKPTPRHIVVHGDWLYLSSNKSGYVSRIQLATMLDHLKSAAGERKEVTGFQEVFVGGGARTIELSPDGRYVFAAVNGRAQIVVVDTKSMEVVSRVRTDSYTVGLAVSPDGKQVWTTSQGRKGKGGNSVCVYAVTRKE